MNRCKNCEEQLDGPYCAACGQKDVDLERPVFALLGDVVRETFDVDGRAMRTLWTLLRHPGRLTVDFLAGRRRLYSPPLRLYLVISVVFFVVTAWVAQRGILLSAEQTLENDAAGQARLFSDFVPKLMFFLLPVFALVLKVTYRQRLYFDHLIHSLHLHSAVFMILIVLLPLEKAADRNTLAMVVQLSLMAYLMIYLARSLRRVYPGAWSVTVAKTIGVVLAYSILIGMLIETAAFLTVPGADKILILDD